VHSGDSACVIPTQGISPEALATIREWTPKLAKDLRVIGLINIQYCVQDNQASVSWCFLGWQTCKMNMQELGCPYVPAGWIEVSLCTSCGVDMSPGSHNALIAGRVCS
jgi:hypothetical protein